MEKMHIKLNVNGKDVDILTEPRTLLIHALREELGITGPHIGCSSSHCGACTVDMNGTVSYTHLTLPTNDQV